MKDLNIIIIDHKTDGQKAKDVFLQINSHSTVYLADNDVEAWSLLDGDTKLNPLPKIIIVDVNKEEVNGMVLLDKIRNHPLLKSLLVFVLSDSDTNKEEALKFNIAGYINKPLDTESSVEVYSKLNEYLSIIEFPRDNQI